MKYKRYGKFSMADYWSAWIAITTLCTIGVIGIFLNVSFVLSICEWLFSALLLFAIIVPNCECFIIADNIIATKKLIWTTQLTIPEDSVVIISYSDICPQFIKQVSIANQTYALAGRVSVSFLKDISFENTLWKLHNSCKKKYTNSLIEYIFEYQFIYSFVCDEALLFTILQKHNYTIIMPKSLSAQFPKIKQLNGVYLDVEY